MTWYVFSIYPSAEARVTRFPFSVGRQPLSLNNSLCISNPTVSREQFSLSIRLRSLIYKNLSKTSPAEINGAIVADEQRLDVARIYEVKMGDVFLVMGADENAVKQRAAEMASDLYIVEKNGEQFGPMSGETLLDYCERGVFLPSTKVWCVADPYGVMEMAELVDFGDVEPVHSSPLPAATAEKKRAVSAEEVKAELGESFMCPYCRTVSDLADVLSVSVSASLLGDPILGEGEQCRFLPSQFTANGLAIDPEGGVCTEIACPRCHMALPRRLLDTEQIVMSVIGAAGAGKSVFLASSMWQCRHVLSRQFGVSFMDLDPVANRWINAYEEKLFFQEDTTQLQQIEKTDLQASNVSRSVMLDGDSVLLSLPSFFSLDSRKDSLSRSLVVYDSAGEHFRAGADTQSSAVTLNMLNSDVLFFMYDPSADPRFRDKLDRGSGTAHNYAQRQDSLLAEMSARIRRHMGNWGEQRLTRPLIFGVSKADLLKNYLPLDCEIYTKTESGSYALDMTQLKKVSDATEALLDEVAPEVSATAHHIAKEVWFIPISALGHNPMREGVRPCDIKPLWTELPVVFTLAKKGLIPTVG